MEKRSEPTSLDSAALMTDDLTPRATWNSGPPSAVSATAVVSVPFAIDHGGAADRVIDDAIEHMQRVNTVHSSLQQRGRLAAYDTLGRLYVISMRAKEDDRFMARLMQRAPVRMRRDTTYHHAVVRALLKLAGGQVPTSTVSDWSKVLRACEYRKVDPTVAAVRRWLDMPECLPNRPTDVSGYEKAHAVVKLYEARTREREKGAKDMAMMKRWLAYAEARRANPITTIQLSGKASSLPKGHALLLVHVDGVEMSILDEFETDLSRIQALVLKRFA